MVNVVNVKRDEEMNNKQATVPENAPDFEVATVRAEDLDTDVSITYRLVAGDLDKFAVHPETGVVRTLRGLDFERAQHHQLVVGTEEGRMLGEHCIKREAFSLVSNLNFLPLNYCKAKSDS